MNKKDERIYKLYMKGLPIKSIMKKVGIIDEQRIKDALKRKGVK